MSSLYPFRLADVVARIFQSPSMAFAHYDFARGASIREHFHPQPMP
jgi:hypothetical protein